LSIVRDQFEKERRDHQRLNSEIIMQNVKVVVIALASLMHQVLADLRKATEDLAAERESSGKLQALLIQKETELKNLRDQLAKKDADIKALLVSSLLT